MYTAEEIKIANDTVRSAGTSVFDKDGRVRSIVAKYIAERIDKDKTILDYGCGPKFVQGNYLRSLGFNVKGYDFGKNKPTDGVELGEKYDVVMCSNVLNVQSSYRMMKETLQQIYDSLNKGGIFVCNYPYTPRKMPEFTPFNLMQYINFAFKNKCLIQRVGGTKKEPLLMVIKF